ncbi:MAG: replicative DNA helicase, partial [Candidatus Binatus sp.]
MLGAILLDNDAINHAVEILTAEEFYRESHREIFRAMIELTDHNQAVDAITLTEALGTKGVLEQIGGPAYIGELAAFVPTAANISEYARIVHDKAVLRSLASISTAIASSAYEAPRNVDEFLDEAEHQIFEIAERRVKQSFFSMRDVTFRAVDYVERLYHRRELITGVPTGFIDLDGLTAGLQPSDLVVIAARPSMGKTALALNIAAYVAMEADPPVGVAFFSLEMSKEQLALRMLCSYARVDSARARRGTISQEELTRLVQAAGPLTEAKIFIDDSSDTNALTLKAKCRRLARDKSVNLGLVVVDY